MPRNRRQFVDTPSGVRLSKNIEAKNTRIGSAIGLVVVLILAMCFGRGAEAASDPAPYVLLPATIVAPDSAGTPKDRGEAVFTASEPVWASDKPASEAPTSNFTWLRRIVAATLIVIAILWIRT